MATHQQKVIKKDGVWTVDGRPREIVKPLSHVHPYPGKSLVTVLITLPPNGASPPHTHSGAAVTGLPVSGACLNQMNCDEPKVYRVGETFYEAPGCHHVRCENISDTEEAVLYSTLLLDDEVLEKGGPAVLMVVDAEEEEKKKHEAEKRGNEPS